jgi:hypothetical protein
VTASNISGPGAALSSEGSQRGRFRRLLPPTLSRPATVTVAGVLLFISAGLTGLAGFVLILVSGATSGTRGNMIFVYGSLYLLLAGFEVLLGRRLLDGHPWARHVVNLLIILGAAAVVREIMSDPAVNVVVLVVGLAINLGVLVCLNTPQARAYFRS